MATKQKKPIPCRWNEQYQYHRIDSFASFLDASNRQLNLGSQATCQQQQDGDDSIQDVGGNKGILNLFVSYVLGCSALPRLGHVVGIMPRHGEQGKHGQNGTPHE
jgi:hypothetical protein